MKSQVLKDHYRTIILICCFLALFINQGLASTSFSVYQSYIVQIPQVGDAGGSLVVTVRTFVSLISMFFVGFYYRKISVRGGLFIACLLTSIGFAIYGLTGFYFERSLLILCIGSALTGAGYGLGGIVVSTTLIGNWFRGHIGSAAGLAGMGSGIAAVIIPVIAADIIKFAGLSVSFFFESLLALILSVTIFVLVRNTPSEIGTKPYSVKDHFAKQRRSRICVVSDTLSKPDRLMMIIASFLLGSASVVGISYFAVLMTSSGVNVVAAAVITSILGAVLTISKIVSGWTFDILGTRAGSTLFFGFLVVGLLLCFGIQTGSATDAFFAGVLFGMGSALATTGLAVWAVELSTLENRMGFLKNLSIAFAFGGFLFNMMPGLLVGVFGNYEISYLILAIMSLISAILVFCVYTRNTKCTERKNRGRHPSANPRSKRSDVSKTPASEHDDSLKPPSAIR